MADKYFSVKMLMGAIQYAASQLAELDESFRQKLSGIDSVTQWRVKPDGPTSYTIIKNSKIEYKMDATHENPTYTITCNDLDVALDIFQGRLDPNEALNQGKIKIEGDAAKAQKEMFILETLGEYLADIQRRGGD